MAKLCRSVFSTLLETDGLLPKLLMDNFEPNHSLYDDITNQKLELSFKDYIYNLVDTENNNKIKTYKTPKELLNDAGYDLYECKSEEEIQSFKKYYSKGEELCTFRGRRLDNSIVFFAVKKDVENIKREDYKNPQRQDKYSTSVMSIQFTRDGSHTLSIISRYNHTVNNPNSTFSNNLDNIIAGLTESFEKEYGLIQQHKNNGFQLKGYVRASDGKYYKYNYEVNNRFFCPNNIIIDDFQVKKYEPEKYIVFDYFILDLVNKEIKLYDVEDTFVNTIKDVEKIEIEKNKKQKEIRIKEKNHQDIKIVLDENNKMIKLLNPNVEVIENGFLSNNKFLQELSLPNLKKVGNDFLYSNNLLSRINFPNLKEVGDYFLYLNNSMEELIFPKLEKVGDNFLAINKTLKVLDFPNLKKIEDSFLYWNESLQSINFPRLEEVGEDFLNCNKALESLSLLNLKTAGNNFLQTNCVLKEVCFPKLEEVGNNFLGLNKFLKLLNLPKLNKMGDNFLFLNKILEQIIIPNLKEVGDDCFFCNESAQILFFPKLEKVGNKFLGLNSTFMENDYKNKIKQLKA